MMKQYGEKYRSLNIPVNEIFSSEYYFVWQYAQAAFNEPIKITRDLTGSLDFSDTNELNDSLQRLRDRTMTKPPKGKIEYYSHIKVSSIKHMVFIHLRERQLYLNPMAVESPIQLQY